MDRRQKKTRNAIFTAFCRLLSHREYAHVTVGDIIREADIGRATFYAHFETKDSLLSALCEELFAHLFGEEGSGGPFISCHEENGVFLHLLRHLSQEGETPLARLLSSPSNELFLSYFKRELVGILMDRLPPTGEVPVVYRARYLAAVMVESVMFWLDGGRREPPEHVAAYLDCMLGEAGLLLPAGEEKNVAK